MVDQMLNNYLGTGVLDAGENTANNDEDVSETRTIRLWTTSGMRLWIPLRS